MEISGWPNEALSPAYTMSHINASSQPPPSYKALSSLLTAHVKIILHSKPMTQSSTEFYTQRGKLAPYWHYTLKLL